MTYYVLIETLSGFIREVREEPGDYDPREHFIVLSETPIDPSTHFFRNNALHEIPPRPSDWATWDVTTGQWLEVEDPVELALKLDELKKSYLTVLETKIAQRQKELFPTGVGQAAAYEAKYLLAISDDPASSAELEGEAAAKGVSVETLRQQIIEKRNETFGELLRLDRLRVIFKRNLEAATTLEAAKTLYNEVLTCVLTSSPVS